MAHVHSQVQHAHGARHANERRVGLAAVLTGGFMVVELFGGLFAGSLALVADAGHMLTDFASLFLAWLAFRMSRRPADGRRTFGFDRLEVLAAFVNGLALFGICVWIVIEAARRFFDPVDILPVPMLVIASLGLTVNIVAFAILHQADQDNLNIRAASMHVIGDLLGSVAAIAAAIIILTIGWSYADPLLSVFVAGLIFRGAWQIVGAAGHILLEGVPPGLNTQLIVDGLVAEISGVIDVHHVHAWSVNQERPMVTLHAQIEDGLRGSDVIPQIKSWLHEHHNIDHTTVEIERIDCADENGDAGDASETGSVIGD